MGVRLCCGRHIECAFGWVRRWGCDGLPCGEAARLYSFATRRERSASRSPLTRSWRWCLPRRDGGRLTQRAARQSRGASTQQPDVVATPARTRGGRGGIRRAGLCVGRQAAAPLPAPLSRDGAGHAVAPTTAGWGRARTGGTGRETGDQTKKKKWFGGEGGERGGTTARRRAGQPRLRCVASVGPACLTIHGWRRTPASGSRALPSLTSNRRMRSTASSDRCGG